MQKSDHKGSIMTELQVQTLVLNKLSKSDKVHMTINRSSKDDILLTFCCKYSYSTLSCRSSRVGARRTSERVFIVYWFLGYDVLRLSSYSILLDFFLSNLDCASCYFRNPSRIYLTLFIQNYIMCLILDSLL